MKGFVIVAIVEMVSLGFGIAMGMLIVTVLGRRKVRVYPEPHDEDDQPLAEVHSPPPARWPDDDN